MFGLGWGELLILAVIGLVLIGPKQLPDAMKSLARFIKEISKARDEWINTVRSDDTIREIHESVNDVKSTLSKPINDIKKNLKEEIDRHGRPNLEEALEEMTEVYSDKDESKIKKGDSEPL